MENKVFIDENRSCCFDFSHTLWATDQLHSIYGRHNLSLLSDVDFIAETADSILFVEYKNALIPNANNPEAFRPSDDKAIRKIAYKFFDSLVYIWASRKYKNNRLIYILEYPRGDVVTRKEIRNRIRDYLPFSMQSDEPGLLRIIDSIAVLSIDEWNEQYPEYPICKI